MKALTLYQPWAQLVALGAKRVETRSWATRYRGPIAIHASKRYPMEAQYLALREPFRSHLPEAVEDLPRGVILAVTTIEDCVSTGLCGVLDDSYAELGLPAPGSNEYEFGDYGPNRYGWILGDDVLLLPEPVPCRGGLGLWDVPLEIEAMIYRQGKFEVLG